MRAREAEAVRDEAFEDGGVASWEVDVLIPAHNEADRISATVRAARELPGVSSVNVVVVDDGSTDGTADAAERAGAVVLRLARNSGKGQALNAGLGHCTKDVLLILDADLAQSAREASKLLWAVVHEGADMAIASFPPGRGRGRSGGLGLAKGLARWGIMTLTGFAPLCPLSGQRAVRRGVLDAVGGFAHGFGVETALTIDALRAGFKLREVPVAMEHRATGRDFRGILHRGRQFIHVLCVLVPRFLAGWRSKWNSR